MSALQDSRITEQHNAIEHMISDIEALGDRAVDRARVSKMLSVFMKLAGSYFDNEEKVMMTKGYRPLPSHRSDHRRIIETLELIIQVCCDDSLPISNDIGGRIRELMDEHIKTYDKSMMSYLDKIG
ncbi:MAG: hemerythrin family protein [Rhodospirillaceae bacterium]